jgi:hypothetical protein
MKQILHHYRFVFALVLLAFAAGCATTTTTHENLLAAAGFEQKTADTPKKQELLATLPKGRLTLITWKGKKYYVQPDDVTPNLAWVGREQEFQAYHQLRLAKQISDDNLMAAQMSQHDMWAWGGAWGPSFYYGHRWH